MKIKAKVFMGSAAKVEQDLNAFLQDVTAIDDIESVEICSHGVGLMVLVLYKAF